MAKKVYSSLTEIVSTTTKFNVVECNDRSQDGIARFVVKLRTNSEPSESGGLKTAGSQLTLYVSVIESIAKGGVIDVIPSDWDFTVSEFPHPKTGEMLSLKWLRRVR